MDREEIEGLVELASSDPANALAAAEAAAEEASGTDRAAALLAVGVAHRNLGHPVESVEQLRRAAKAAWQDTDLLARIELSLAGSLGFVGQFDEARQLLDRLVENDDELHAAKAEHQRATLMQRAGDTEAAVEGYERAITIFRKHDRPTAQGHLHTNLGILFTYEGKIEEALTQLDRAMDAYERAGELQWQAMTVHNRGWTISCTGDLPAALALLDEAEDRFAALNVPEGSRTAVRAEALLRAGLYQRAHDDLVVAADELLRLGLLTDRAEVLVQASQAATMAGRRSSGRQLAEEAQALLEDQGRSGWQALAVAAELEAGGRPSGADDVPTLAADLVAAGHSAVAFRVLTAAAWTALETGDQELAGSLVGLVPPIELTPSEQVRLAALRLRLLTIAGDPTTGLEIAEDAYARIEWLIDGVGSLDLVGGAAYELDRLVAAAKAALPQDDVGEQLRWAERRRAVGARRWPRQTGDVIRGLLNRYRAVDGQVHETPDDAELRKELTEIQRQIETSGWTGGASRQHHRSSASGPSPETGALVDLSVNGDLVQIALVVGGQSTIVDRRPLPADLVVAADRLHRLWMGAAPAQEPSLADRCLDLVAELEGALLGDVGLPDGPLTIAIDPELRGIPFGCLPLVTDRPVTISPWRGDTEIHRPSGGRLLIPDPDLSVADRERSSIVRGGGWTVLQPGDSVDRAVDELSKHRVIHISSHGGVEEGNPMFSWLGLPAGRLYLQDVTRLSSAPEVVVIAACLAASARPFGPAGALSFAEGFLGAGCRWVVASPSVLPDDAELARFVGELHTHLAKEIPPPEALTVTRRNAIARGDRRAAGAFVCYST